ncbi:MAG: DUF5666 domain-containing protein, partial [Balneolaceae bacterium]
MRTSQNLLFNLRLTGIYLACLIIISGCSIDALETSSEQLSDEELEIASQIVGESLSDQEDGIFSSLNDAFIIPSDGSFTTQSAETGEAISLLKNISLSTNENSGHGNENDYSYTYNTESGTHEVSFSRDIQNGNISKNTTVNLTYIYLNADGGFINNPEVDQDRIETIDYSAERSGSIKTTRKSSSYQRTDQFLIDRLSSGTNAITIDGSHSGSGTFEVTNKNGNIVTREYTLTVDFLDVTINSESISVSKTLRKGVTGALAYEMVINRIVNGDESTKTVNGTIEFTGDGTALLKFSDALDDFRINIEDGDVFEDDEFEGFIRTVDLENSTFTLYNDDVIGINSDTEINSDSDLSTLQEVQEILDRDIRVEAEGNITQDPDGNLVATQVKFEYEEEDLEFEGLVTSVNLEEGSFTLENGSAYYITGESDIADDEDFSSLEEVETALNNDTQVKAEGEFTPGDDDRQVVLSVEFEIEEEKEEEEFEGIVQSVHHSLRSFDLEDGRTIQISGRTEIEGDLGSMEEVLEALEEGFRVVAEGKYFGGNSNGRLVATEIEFEAEEQDDDG